MLPRVYFRFANLGLPDALILGDTEDLRVFSKILKNLKGNLKKLYVFNTKI